MKKAAIIFAIALIGIIGVIDKSQSAKSRLVTPPSSAPNSSASSSTPVTTSYKNGSFTGDSEATPYGAVQIAVVVSGGKIINVNFLQMPSDQRESQQRTELSEPLLKQTTLSKQNANIDFVSGATQTSVGYQQSLQSALDQAAQA